VEAVSNDCIKVGCLHHTPWGAALPRTLRERGMLCAPGCSRITLFLLTDLFPLAPLLCTDSLAIILTAQSVVVQQVIDEFDQHVHFVEIDITEDPEIAEAAEIMGTPCVQFFKNKEMLRLVILILHSMPAV